MSLFEHQVFQSWRKITRESNLGALAFTSTLRQAHQFSVYIQTKSHMGLKGASFLVNWLKVHLLLTDKFLTKLLTAGGGWYLMEKCSG